MKSTWKINNYGEGLPVNTIINNILSSRGIKEGVEEFLNPSTVNILPTSQLSNIDTASKIFIEGINLEKQFLIHVDVDTDGCSAGAIMYRYLTRCGLEPYYHINEGKKHGVQANFQAPDDVDIIVIMDSINDNMTEYNRILESGKQLIILDHHVPTQEILDNQYKLNLVSSAINYSNSSLSGSGVTWKFVNYIDYLCDTNFAEDLEDLAATGIIADVCDVSNNSMENRAICNIAFTKGPVNTAISLMCDGELNSHNISFSIANYVNAANRMNDNHNAFRLFIEDKKSTINEILDRLEEDKELQKVQAEKLYENMKSEADLQMNCKIMFFFNEDFGNLTGLLATRATTDYTRPCIVLNTKDNNYYQGSMRCNFNIDLRSIINEFEGVACNGHETSAGIRIRKDVLDNFVQFMEDRLSNIEIKDLTEIDISLNISQVTPFIIDRFNYINRITGSRFRPIKVMVNNINNYTVDYMSSGKHLCIKTPNVNFIEWNTQGIIDCDGCLLQAVGQLKENKFRGRTTLQMIMSDYDFVKPYVNPF